jgi:para-nitrobenzyl esterase
MMLEQMMGGNTPAQSEDCLYLNVWTPSTTGKRPVMVWIHGGAFMFGSGSTPWYDGTRFATNGDVVLVTINYRLGPLGFLHLGDLFDDMEHSGNLGILDQIAALGWVRDSIAGFGGDPDDVTIFGESAGAGSIGTLLGTPAAQGLFRQAILQSGAASWGLPRDLATDNARRVLAELGIEPGDRDSLLAADADAIVAAGSTLGTEVSGGSLPYAPVHDGTVLPQPPIDAIAAGMSAGVRVLCGTNADEMTLFAIIDPTLNDLDDEQVATRLAAFDPTIDPVALVRAYSDRNESADFRAVWIAMASDAVFRIPAIRLVEAHLEHGDAWMYHFTWATPVFGGVLGSTHALEIPFVFDNLHQPGVPMFTGEGPERAELARRMHATWLAFVRQGHPEHDDIPAWPRYDLERRPTMRIDEAWELVHDPDGEVRKHWEHQIGLQ